MPVFRVEKTKDYTVMSNYHLRDKNLTLKAKGLLSWMLSNTEDWDYTVAGIVSVMKESRDAINSALCELEDYGYLTRKQVRSNGGKFSDMEYVITEKPITENPITVNPQQINTNLNKHTKEKNLLPTVKEEQAPPSTQNKSYKEVFEDPSNKYVREALEKFIRDCEGRNIRFRVTTVERFAKTLRDNAKEDPALALAMVDQSIDRGWKDIYPLKSGYKKPEKKEAVSIPVSKEDKAKNPDGSYVVY